MVRLTAEPIDYHALTEQVCRPGCGAVVLFLGTVRDLTGGRETVALDYEAYPAMAEKKLAEIEADTRARWPVGDLGLVHRLRRPGGGGGGWARGAWPWRSVARTGPKPSRPAAMPSTGSRSWCRSGRRKTGPTAAPSG